METSKKICGNCMSCCIHSKSKDVYRKEEYKDEDGKVWMTENVFDHCEWFCDINSPEYESWHERNKNNTYPKYCLDYCSCYEPEKSHKLLCEMNDLAQNILDDLNKKEIGVVELPPCK